MEPVAHICHFTSTLTSGQPGPLSINQLNFNSNAQGCKPVIPALKKWRTKAQEFKVSLGYTVQNQPWL